MESGVHFEAHGALFGAEVQTCVNRTLLSTGIYTSVLCKISHVPAKYYMDHNYDLHVNTRVLRLSKMRGTKKVHNDCYETNVWDE